MSTEPRLSVAEAAAYLGLDESAVYRLCAARRVRHLRLGARKSRISFDKADLDAYVQSCYVEVGEPRASGAGKLPTLKHICMEPRPRRRGAS